MHSKARATNSQRATACSSSTEKREALEAEKGADATALFIPSLLPLLVDRHPSLLLGARNNSGARPGCGCVAGMCACARGEGVLPGCGESVLGIKRSRGVSGDRSPW